MLLGGHISMKKYVLMVTSAILHDIACAYTSLHSMRMQT